VAKGLDTVAHVYASALLELAFGKGVPGEVLRDMQEVGRLLDTDKRAFTFFITPNIRKDAKRTVIDRAFGGRVSEIVQNFLKVVIDKGRAQALPGIVQSFVAMYHERQGELVVKVASAQALEDDERDKLRETLRKKYRAKGYNDVVLEERVDEKLLGGVIVRTGDTLYDGSLKTRLAAIGDRLRRGRLKIEEVVHED
jgi:F-type H+-transporting ATPase subunit delta